MYSFIIGVIIASFCNVIISRLINNESIVVGRSHCDNCHKTLKFYDLIPIISYILLKGKCRYCKNNIPIYVVLLEIVGGLLSLYLYLKYELFKAMIIFIVLMLLICISIIDIQYKIILDTLNLFLFIIIIISMFIININIIERFIGFIIISIPMYLLSLIKKDSVGGGDIKLIALLGLFLGYKDLLLALSMTIISASIYSLYLIIFYNYTRKTYIAFAPFITIGIMIVLLI